MTAFFQSHRALKISLLGIGFIVLIVVLFAALFDWNLLRPMVARTISAKTGRVAEIHGNLRVHPFSWTPTADIQGLTLKNPSWAHEPLMLSVKDIALSVSLPRLLRGQIVIPSLVIDEPAVNLERDAEGRASWELGSKTGKPNNDTSPTKLPAIQRLIIKDGRLQVEDLVRKLKFGGTIGASDGKGESAFEIKAAGTLNAKPFSLSANGGGLLNISPDRPYSFSVAVTASDIKLQTKVTVRKPFDFGLLDVQFSVSGNDLADAYYLTALALPNTPPYKVSAEVHVTGTTYRVDNLQGKLGNSDLSGHAEVINRAPRPKLSATLVSTMLDMADLAPTLGKPPTKPDSLAANQPDAKGKLQKKSPAPAAQESPFLLPDADLQLNRVRSMDADVHFQANAVKAPKVPMKAVTFHLTLDAGLLTIDPLDFVLDQGKFAGRVQIDARNATQVNDIDMHVDGIDLSQFKTASMKDPPMQGTLDGRVKLKGTGSSIHKFASTADGSVSFVLPKGEMTSAIAEATGINVVQALGFVLAKNEDKTEIRCSVIDFQDQQGDLGAKTFFVDTTNVLISGKGNVDLKSEKLDLSLKGDPKKVRLSRLRSPITLKGTLEHPSVGVDVGKLAGQGAVAAALGVLLTPAAAVLAFIDPGLAKNKDCAASLSDEQQATSAGQ